MNDGMNAAPGPTHPFTNVDPDDADHLLYMIEQAHQPFRAPPVTVGDVAEEWVKRWRRAQPKPQRDVGSELNIYANPSYRALQNRQGVHSPAPGRDAGAAKFSFEEAVKVIETRWPGIKIGEPQRAWSRMPVIAELNRLRLAVRQTDPNQAPEGTARYRELAPVIARDKW